MMILSHTTTTGTRSGNAPEGEGSSSRRLRRIETIARLKISDRILVLSSFVPARSTDPAVDFERAEIVTVELRGSPDHDWRHGVVIEYGKAFPCTCWSHRYWYAHTIKVQ